MVRVWRGFLGVGLVAAFLAGCTGAVPPTSSSGVQARPAVRDAGRGNLLYVAGGCGGTCVLTYPKAKPSATLSVAGVGLCSDKHGNVFMPTATSSGNAVVYEYAHGATSPKATLTVPGILAEGCAVDPATGNLAVTYICSACSYGPLAVFAKAKGSPEIYEQAGVYLSYCGYDDKGNLFTDGNGAGFSLLELPKGGNALEPISVSQSITEAGQVQWDGTYLAIEDLSHPVIYQFSISGSTATRKGTTQLNGAGTWSGQSWIQGKTVIVPFATTGSSPNELGYWSYPAGGAPTKIVKKHLGTGTISAVAVSLGR